jgi:hypothetical protein
MAERFAIERKNPPDDVWGLLVIDAGGAIGSPPKIVAVGGCTSGQRG